MKSTLRSIKEPGTSSPTAKWFTCTPNTQRPTAAHYEGLDYVTHTGGVECPPGPACQFVPALYQQFSDDPSDYGNYDLANRPADGLKIRYIIHDTEGSYESALGTFTTPSYVSAHYLIRSSDGFVTQLGTFTWHEIDVQDYYDVTFNSPQDYKVVNGEEQLYLISLNHGIVLVRAEAGQVISWR